jgi:N6-L-threonylcarbamoyladenine synthase
MTRKNEGPIILAIESSCDDTSASVIVNGCVRSNITFNQTIHSKYGGVVPELASRKHHIKILPVIKEALQVSKVNKSDLHAIAVTKGPGLLGSLLVGVSFAKSMAAALQIPLIEVNHMQAHILAHFIEKPSPKFPFLCLTVSGGHTQIVRVDDFLKMTILGHTIDDAAGEAFDKTGKLLGLPYPSGPLIDKYAKQGNPNIMFSKPKVDGLNFSFSGLKTSILYHLQREVKKKSTYIDDNLVDICASVQKTIIDILVEKITTAAIETGISQIAIAGGVSANSGLRNAMMTLAKNKDWEIFIPKLEYCTDNAAMIAMTAHYKYLSKNFASLDLAPDARMKF